MDLCLWHLFEVGVLFSFQFSFEVGDKMVTSARHRKGMTGLGGKPAELDTHPAAIALPVLLFVAPAQAGVPSIARLMGSENKNIQYNQ